MVNPYTYKNFEVTEEPAEDPDPNAADSIAGFELPSPFGRQYPRHTHFFRIDKLFKENIFIRNKDSKKNMLSGSLNYLIIFLYLIRQSAAMYEIGKFNNN